MTPDRANRAMILTPPGAGAIGVVRVVGPESVSLVHSLFQSKTGRSLTKQTQGQLLYGLLVHDGETIDDVIVSIAPGSAPPAVDICCHGGIRVIERILDALERRGAIIQEQPPGPADIWPAANAIEREANDALARCQTIRAVHFVAHQRQNLVPALRKLADLYATDSQKADETLRNYINGYRSARTFIDGATLAILGPPNAGKSTLFNLLAGRTAAIVSPQPGTTRDWVTATIEIEGVPVILLDTAGLRDASNPLELEAIHRGTAAAAADIRILLLDGAQPLPPNPAHLATRSKSARLLVAINKADQPRAWPDTDLPPELQTAAADPIRLAALTGQGFDRLTRCIAQTLGPPPPGPSSPCLFTSRQCRYAADILGAGRHNPDHALARISAMIGDLPGDSRPNEA
jgi:tRNA modification GTPase